MIAKGLDFPNVTLVGVFDADSGDDHSGFPRAERTFGLICQVAGRPAGAGFGGGRGGAGRRDGDRADISARRAGDRPRLPPRLHGLRAAELPHRREFGYPPYGRLVRIVLSHKGFAQVHAAAEELMRLITAVC